MRNVQLELLMEFIKSNGLRVKIEVDGGINKENIRDIANAGANMVVVGNALYNSENRKEFIWGLRNCNLGDTDSGNPKRVFQGRESIRNL